MTNRPRVDILTFNFFDWDGARVVVGGAERYVLELARLVGSLGAQPRIVQNAGRYFSKVYADVPVFGVPAGASMDLFAMSAGFREAVSDAALVVASPLELAADLAIGAPIIGISHGIHWDYPNNRMDLHDAAVERRIVDAVLACSACVAVDTNFYNWTRCFDAAAAARIRYIPNFVDLERFRASPKRFDGPRLELLFPRRLSRERGLHEVLEAFDALSTRHPSLELHLCGSGPAEDEAIARAFLERHPHRARWSQLAMDEMPIAYASSHIVLVPTVAAEGTSLSCIEAMATNNAIVTTAVGGLPNLVIDGYNGMIAGPGAKGLIDAIERLVIDRALAGRLAKNALSVVPAFAREHWSARWSALLVEYLPQRTNAATPTIPAVSVDPYRTVAWPFGFEGEIETARAAQSAAEQQLFWRDSELSGIKNSTGWALLQQLYRIRFALFPKGSSRESAGKWLMHRARSLWRRVRDEPRFPQSDAATSDPSQPVSIVPRGLGTATRYAIVCLPILEWGFRIQRPQQLAREFVRRGHDVVFAKHTFGSVLDARFVEPGIEEVELPGVPGTNPYRDRLNDADAQRMADALLAHLARRGSGRFVCLVQLPFWWPVAQRLREASGCDLVYDCMDLHSGFSSNTDVALADEQQLLELSDLVVCSSLRLLEHATSHAKRTALVRNGVDYDAFARVPEASRTSGESVIVGYYGAIADWFDSDLLAAIARLRPQWRIVLIGSTWSADTKPLEATPNIVLTGEKPYAELPSLIAAWHCCIIPFRHTPLTEATNPVKVYEMLAAAKPIVSVGLPELVPMSEAGLLALAEDGEAFVAAVEAQVAADSEERRQARRDYAAANTWQARAEAIDDAIDSLQPEVSIIVVTYNNCDLNELCLNSVFRDSDYANFEVVVVDNASKDATPDFLRAYASREPRLRIVLNEGNLGFAAANNQGAALAQGRYLCFLNNDTVVHGSWLRTLIAHLRRHAHLGLVGPVTNAIGNEAQIPVGYDDLAAMPAWADAHCATHRGRLTEVSMLAFFCVATPRWVWRVVGPLDERFATGMFEDDDYNRRVRAAGFQVGLAWDSYVHHWQMASFKLLGDGEYLRIFKENRSRYETKWSGTTPSLPDPLAALKRAAATSRGTVIFAPSVGWDIPLAQRPHHLARALAQDGYAVVFDCTNAADDVDTLREVAARLFLYKGPSSALAGLPDATLWTFSYNYDYRDAFPPATAVVYDWIDDLTVFPYDQRRLATLHARALHDANVVVSVARQLHDQAVRVRADALYVPNAVEEGRFESEPEPNPALADAAFAAVLGAGRPIAGYYGALARWFDYGLVDAVARLRPDWSFVLIGPDHDGSLARSGLDRLPNVYALGPRAYSSLPGYLHRFDVATIPFAINDITLATSPLKLFEYFAAGRPVISTPMPECAAFDEVRIVVGAQAFSAALDAARGEAADPAFRRRLAALATQNTWRMRARQIMEALEASRRKLVAGTASPGANGEPVLPPALAHKLFLSGRCNVCGETTRFFRDDPALDRESLTCEHCRTTSRYRSIARGVLKAVEQRTGLRADALSGLPAEAESVVFRVYDTQAPFFYEPCAYPLPDLLRRCRWADVTVSAYRPDVPPGELLAAGVVNQNLERLTFSDASFDLVITSDVMEHVRLDQRAHGEIARVLKPGGIYVFTVPHFRDRKDTLVRVAVHDPDDPTRDEHLTVPEYHGDANSPGGNGVLSYRSYGTVIDEELDSLGFDVHYSFEDDDVHGIRDTELFYCVKR